MTFLYSEQCPVYACIDASATWNWCVAWYSSCSALTHARYAFLQTLFPCHIILVAEIFRDQSSTTQVYHIASTGIGCTMTARGPSAGSASAVQRATAVATPAPTVTAAPAQPASTPAAVAAVSPPTLTPASTQAPAATPVAAAALTPPAPTSPPTPTPTPAQTPADTPAAAMNPGRLLPPQPPPLPHPTQVRIGLPSALCLRSFDV